jgi:hypothetical protein
MYENRNADVFERLPLWWFLFGVSSKIAFERERPFFLHGFGFLGMCWSNTVMANGTKSDKYRHAHFNLTFSAITLLKRCTGFFVIFDWNLCCHSANSMYVTFVGWITVVNRKHSQTLGAPWLLISVWDNEVKFFRNFLIYERCSPSYNSNQRDLSVVVRPVEILAVIVSR